MDQRPGRGHPVARDVVVREGESLDRNPVTGGLALVELRRVLLSRYYAGLDEAAMAARFGIAGATVRTRMHRALARLRRRLGDLRAFWPPLLGKLSGQLAAVALVPAVVATWLATGPVMPMPTSAPTPAPLPIVSPRRAPPPAIPEGAPPMLEANAAAPAPMRSRRRPGTLAIPAKAPPSPATIVNHAAPAVEILWPDGIDILAEPVAVAQPSLVAPRPSLAGQIARMVEEDL